MHSEAIDLKSNRFMSPGITWPIVYADNVFISSQKKVVKCSFPPLLEGALKFEVVLFLSTPAAT